MAIELIDSGVMPVVYHCPECKTKGPAYGFHLNGGDLGVVGMVRYFTIFCASPRINPSADAGQEPEICGAILSVQVLEHRAPTDPILLAKLAAQMRAGGPGGRGGGN